MTDLGGQVYNLSMQNHVALWIIDFNSVITFDTATDGMLFLTPYKDGINEITFGGQAYEFIGLRGSGFRSEINGALPEPIIEIDKSSLLKSPKYQFIRNEYRNQTQEVFFDWRGARISRLTTTSNYLTDPSKGVLNEYLVDQITSSNKTIIKAKLTVSIGADRLTNESVQELSANRCALRYRLWDGTAFEYVNENAGGCPYGNSTSTSDWSAVPDFGNLYFTEDDSPTTAENDVCSYTVKGCQSRFDPDENGLTLPFVGKYKNTGNDSGREIGSV